jgi:hypothetical protein
MLFIVVATIWSISIPICLFFGFGGEPLFFITPDMPVASEAWQRGFEYAECVCLCHRLFLSMAPAGSLIGSCANYPKPFGIVDAHSARFADGMCERGIGTR